MIKNNLIILYPTILQLITGLLLLAFPPDHLLVARLGIFFDLFPAKLGGILLLISAGLGFWAVVNFKNHPTMRIFALLPQYVFLILTALSAIDYVFLGHYADGVIRPRVFIFLDQLPAIVAATLYSIAVLQLVIKPRDGQ